MYNGKTVVYTSGTFDMFHSNHLKMIRYARGLGETLIVGVSTDELVSSYKRPPIIPFEERMAIIEALKYPDIVIPQHSLDHTELVKKLNIDVFVVGDDWTGKYDYLRDLGVTVFYFPYGKGVSTTQIKKDIIANYEEIKSKIDHQPSEIHRIIRFSLKNMRRIELVRFSCRRFFLKQISGYGIYRVYILTVIVIQEH